MQADGLKNSDRCPQAIPLAGIHFVRRRRGNYSGMYFCREDTKSPSDTMMSFF